MVDAKLYPLLSQINCPQELRKLSEEELPALCAQLRAYFIETLNKVGGHFGASLGVVELTVALHYLFDTPADRIVWDVGHQAYIHKMLTGRLEDLVTIRQTDGLYPFPSRDESPYDAFGVGHSSTSISAALGMAIANQKLGHNRRAIAVIGDGALTAGMSYEALNHAGEINADLLIIFNDNGMSISPNVGALAKSMQHELNNKIYDKVLHSGQKLLELVPSPFKHFAQKTSQQVKEFLLPGTFFTKLGCDYTGPIDGHNIHELLQQLRSLQQQSGPRVLHIITQKGKGFAAAEADPVKYHAVNANFLNRQSSTNLNVTTPVPTYSDIFGQWICDMAHFDSRLVAITPATREGSGLVKFANQFPNRYFDVGIAEQHAVTFAAGLACEGLKPVVAIYSTFLQRAYDQLIHDVALQNLPVLFAIDRGGLVGADGPTHAGSFDLSYLRCLPNMVVMAPADENECRQMLYSGFMIDGPVAVRYPRRYGIGVDVQAAMQALPLGKAEIKRQGQKIALLAFGSMVSPALAAANTLNATCVNMRFVKPLDESLIIELAQTHDLLVTVEENACHGGAGSGVNELLNKNRLTLPVINLGLPDTFLPSGAYSDLLAKCGLTSNGMISAIEKNYPQLLPKQSPSIRLSSHPSVALTAVK